MKNKYERLSKEEKKKALEDFINEGEKYKIATSKIKRIKYLSFFGFIFGILSFGFDFYLDSSWPNFSLDAILVIFCLFAYIKSKDLLEKQINQFLIERDKKAKK